MKYYITIHDTNQLTHIITYIDNHLNHPNLQPFTQHSFITFGNDNIHSTNDFGYKELNEKSKNPITLSEMREPTGYYPFSPNDEDYVIAPHVLRGFISYLVMKGKKTAPQIKDPQTYVEILKLIHPYNLVSTRHNEQLLKKIEYLIDVFMKSSIEFSEQILKIEKNEYSSATLRSLVKICQKLIEDYESQKKITDNF